jgi:hypothetical protein
MKHRSTAPWTRPRKRTRPGLLLLCVALVLAAAPAWAQVDRRPFAAQSLGRGLFGAEKSGVEQTPAGPLVKGPHCGGAQSHVAAMLTWRLGVAAQDQLLALFDRVLCAPTGAAGEVRVAMLGEDAADPFRNGHMRYSGQPELGGWAPGLQYDDPRATASVSYVGLLLAQPGVSLWEVESAERVRVWYAPFRTAPAHALTFFFEFRSGRWVWTGASSATAAG